MSPASLVIVVIALVPIVMCWGGYVSHPSQAPVADVPGPSQQAFCSVVADYIAKYQGARTSGANQVVLSNLRAERREALRSLFKSTRVSNWTGTIRRIATDTDGTARVAVGMSCGGQVRSNGFGSDTAISRGTALHQVLATLREGSAVIFGGEFYDVGGSQTDWLQEQSITELGSMTNPEFIFAFSSIAAEGSVSIQGASQVAPQPVPAGNLKARITQMQQVVARDPKNVKAWIQLGNDFYDTRQPQKAIEAYDRALELRPNNPNVLTDEGVMFRDLGQFEKAIAKFQKANQVDPKHVQSLYNIGVVYLNDLKQPTKAIDAWNKVIQLAPQSEQAAQSRVAIEEARKLGGG